MKLRGPFISVFGRRVVPKAAPLAIAQSIAPMAPNRAVFRSDVAVRFPPQIGLRLLTRAI